MLTSTPIDDFDRKVVADLCVLAQRTPPTKKRLQADGFRFFNIQVVVNLKGADYLYGGLVQKGCKVRAYANGITEADLWDDESFERLWKDLGHQLEIMSWL